MKEKCILITGVLEPENIESWKLILDNNSFDNYDIYLAAKTSNHMYDTSDLINNVIKYIKS